MRSNPASSATGALLLTAMLLGGCGERETGPLQVTAIGPPPAMINPNLQPVGPASALLLETVAQGLVRFDAAGEIEPALAQSWIVSDDGRRYTFRLSRTSWAGGERVTARQVVGRLQAALSRASRNPLKPVLGSIEQIEAMTDQVLEIRLKAPRPNFLQLLAQPELAIVADGQGAGPYRIGGETNETLRLVPPPDDEEEQANPAGAEPEIRLSAAAPAVAIARFSGGNADFVTGGTVGDLPILRAADIPNAQVAFDPTAGLFGLAFEAASGPLAQATVRQALSMAIDREAIAARLDVPTLQPRTTLLPLGLEDMPAPTAPEWSAAAMPLRREFAARAIAEALEGEERLRLRVAMPDRPGYRILFAHIRRDWRTIGVEAERVGPEEPAELRLTDEVAPARLASWYLRPFVCGAGPICDADATTMIEAARVAVTTAERQALLTQADQALSRLTVFIPIASPVRWSLRSGRLNGFRTNQFARHSLLELIEPRN